MLKKPKVAWPSHINRDTLPLETQKRHIKTLTKEPNA